MAIYDKPVRLLIRDMARDLAPTGDVVFSKRQAIEWFRTNFPSIKQGTVSAHLIRFTTNAPSRLHYNARADEDLFFQIDRSQYRLYDSASDPPPIHSKIDVTVDGVGAEEDHDEETAAPSEFAYESDLRDFLARNLSTIEPGLRLYEEEGITGVEFPVGGRFVDILAVDKGWRPRGCGAQSVARLRARHRPIAALHGLARQEPSGAESDGAGRHRCQGDFRGSEARMLSGRRCHAVRVLVVGRGEADPAQVAT